LIEVIPSDFAIGVPGNGGFVYPSKLHARRALLLLLRRRLRLGGAHRDGRLEKERKEKENTKKSSIAKEELLCGKSLIFWR